MIKIINKIFARKKIQPNNENCKRLCNLIGNFLKIPQKYYSDYFTENVNNIKKNLGRN